MYTIYTNTGNVKRNSDQKIVAPCQSVDDPDYVEYVTWVAQGNQPTEEFEPEVVSVRAVTPRQIRWALSAFGLREAVESAVAASPQAIKDSWEFSTEFERDNPLIADMAAALSIPIEQVDQLFAYAATL